MNKRIAVKVLTNNGSLKHTEMQIRKAAQRLRKTLKPRNRTHRKGA